MEERPQPDSEWTQGQQPQESLLHEDMVCSSDMDSGGDRISLVGPFTPPAEARG